MKKRVLALILGVMMVASVTGCGRKNPPAPAPAPAPVTTTQVANPYVYYNTYDELASAAGYYPMYLEVEGFGSPTFALVDQSMVDISIVESETQEVVYRTTPFYIYEGSEYTITGIDGVAYYTYDYDGYTIYSGTYVDPDYGTTYIYYWNMDTNHGERCYCIEITGEDETFVSWISEQAILQTETIN